MEMFNLEKSSLLVPLVESPNGFLQPTKAEDFVLQVAGLNTMLRKIIYNGKEESHQNGQYSVHQGNGKFYVRLYGKEIMQLARDVGKDSTILKTLFMSTTSNPLSVSNHGMKLITSFLSVMNAIDGFIQNETLTNNISFEIASNFGYTQFGVVGEDIIVMSDTQRYKQLGNAVTVNVVEAIVTEMILKGVF